MAASDFLVNIGADHLSFYRAPRISFIILGNDKALFDSGGGKTIYGLRILKKTSSKIEPATALAEALNAFDPLRPLQTDSELRDLFVAREYSPLEPLISYLSVRTKPAKALFMGNRGSGKSTELAKLATRLRDSFLVVHFHAGRLLNVFDLEPVDVVLGCALALMHEAASRNALVDKKLYKELDLWLRNEVLAETVSVKPSPKPAEFGFSLDFLVGEVSAKWNAESTTRKTIRPRLQTMLTELVARINQMLAAIQPTVKKPVLVLIEDLDKTGLGQARKVFFEEGQLLRLLECHIVYTFPIALRYSNDYAQIRNNFEVDFKLPNIKINDRSGHPNEKGRSVLRDLALRRADISLFEEGALERAIEWSGGLVVDLVRLLQGAFLTAMVQQTPRITPVMVDGVAAEIRSDFRAALRAEHYRTLQDAADRHEVVNETAVQETLHNLSLLEYRNAEDWCDVHPIAKPLLKSPES